LFLELFVQLVSQIDDLTSFELVDGDPLPSLIGSDQQGVHQFEHSAPRSTSPLRLDHRSSARYGICYARSCCPDEEAIRKAQARVKG
jgi:hypothetical protein